MTEVVSFLASSRAWWPHGDSTDLRAGIHGSPAHQQ
jgi:hypothetical protein